MSFVRIVLAAVFVVMYLQNELFWRTFSIAVFAIAAVTDFFDGYIARHYGAQSASGEFLDPLADKVLTFSGFICLPFLDANQFTWWGVVLIIARDTFTTILRIWADRRQFHVKTLYSAKVKTFVQMIFLYIAILTGVFAEADIDFAEYARNFLSSGILGGIFTAVVIFTVYTGIEYAFVNRQVLYSRSQPL